MRHRQRKIKKIKEAVDIPIVAIGGIKKDNIDALTGTGIDGVAVVSAIFGAKDIIKDTKELLKTVKKMKQE